MGLGRVLALCIVAGLVMVCAHAQARVSLYVSPKGNDEWMGRKPDGGAPDGPFATLQRAVDELARLKRGSRLEAGATIYVRSGRYYLDKPLTIGPEASGTKEAPVVIRPYAGEKPRLIGGKVLAGFKPWRGEIVQCDVAKAGLGGVVFRQLFFNGQRQVLARYPNFDPSDPHQGRWAHVARVAEGRQKREFFATPDVRLERWSRAGKAQVCIHPGYDWAWNILPVARVVPSESRIVLARNTSYDMRIGDRYFVQNLLEELDAPGEWYLDEEAAVLYFWPPSDLADGEVIAPVVGTLLEMQGAKHVTIRGFTIEMCDADAVRLVDCESCLIAACTIRNCGRNGIVISGGHNTGAKGNDVYACGHAGIVVRGGDRNTLEPAHNFADNNYIHHCGVFHKTYRPGVNVNGVGNRASHNLIHDMPHAGLLLGGNDNVVEYNVVHHVNLESADTGGIYFCSRDWTQRGNVIRYNIFHHCGGFGKTNSWNPVARGRVEFVYPHFTWGIYLDDPTTGTLVHGNILYNVPICALHNHGGRDNTWENNIIVDAPALQAGMLSPNWSEWPRIIQRLRQARYPGSPYLKRYPELAAYTEATPEHMSGIKFVRNIIYYTVEGTKWLREHRGSGWGGKNCQLLYGLRMRPDDFEDNVWDYNLIAIEPPLQVRISLHIVGQARELLTWEKWRARGKDEHSVLGDPGFVDAAARDFRLRPDSPALKLGFKPIPVEKIGPYKDELRASWPIVEAPGAAALGEFTTRRYFEPPQFARLPAIEFAARKGLGNLVSRANAGRPLRVAYFGGGIHRASGWRKGLMDLLAERFGQVQAIDASICDCVRGSAFSVYRFRHDVLAHKPDLVVVDFASDDWNTDPATIMSVIEGIVRQAWEHDPTLDILFVYAFRAGYEQDYAAGKLPYAISAYERVAQHYGIPSVNMGFEVARLYREGKLIIEGDSDEAKAAGKLLFSRDGVRPTSDGDRIYTHALAKALGEMARVSKPSPHELPAPLISDRYQHARLVPVSRGMLSGDWAELPPEDPLRKRFGRHFDTIWFTNTPGARLTFTFKGTAASLYHLIGPDTGQVRITVDGKDAGVRRQVDRWCYFQRLAALPLADGLPDGRHTITVELLQEPPDRSEPIAEAKRLGRYDSELFEGVALRVGFIRVMGEAVRDGR